MVVALGLMSGAAGFILHAKNSQRLGEPGLKSEGLPDGKILVPLPDVAGFASVELPARLEELGALPADTSINRRGYKAGNFEAILTIVTMGRDRTSIHKPQFCLTGQGWSIDPAQVATIPMTRPRSYALPVNKLTATKSYQTPTGRTVTEHVLYIYWFATEGQVTASDSFMKSIGFGVLRTGVLQRWSYISCFVPCLPGQEEAAWMRAKELLAAAVPEFQLAAAD
ncbi:MAG: exosortase-associated EpsI family protein [Verrucomicrobiota bacterium]